MPTVFYEKGYRVYFFSYDCREKPHVHVDKGGASAKIWLTPVEVEWSYFTKADTRRVVQMIESRWLELMTAWHEHCKE